MCIFNIETYLRGRTVFNAKCLLILIFLLSALSCSEPDDEIPKIATVKIEFTLPNPTPFISVDNGYLHGWLDCIVSTDFTLRDQFLISKPLYNTKSRFRLTESFRKDFNLNPDDPRIAVEISNATRSNTVSARLIVLIDGEEVHNKSASITKGASFLYFWTNFTIKVTLN